MNRQHSSETQARIEDWSDACTEYWKQFEGTARVTEEMINGAPKPPDDIVIDTAAVLVHALACALHQKRTGEHTTEPSMEAQLEISNLIDKSVGNAEDGMSTEERYLATGKMWSELLGDDE